MPIKIVRKAAGSAPEPASTEGLAPKPKRALKSPGKVLDGQCMAVCQLVGRPAVSWFLMASYLYYIHDLPLLSDDFYDRLAMALLHDYDDLEHAHAALISKEALRAGTMYHLRADQYPLSTRGAAAHIANLEWDLKIDIYKDCDDFERDT
jgi:hypothetical protein